MSNEQTKTTALARPGKDIRDMIAGDHFKQQVSLALPRHMTPDRFARVALTALTRTPKLMDCTRESLLKCLMDCSQLGLEPDGRHAHLIPYGKECTLIIDYKGLIALARRSGDVAVFNAQLVKAEDEFHWRNGVVTHEVNWRADRGKTDCVYSYVRFKDGAEDWEVMTLAEVEAIRKRSRAGQSGPWVSDFDEMAKKTVIRRHSKRLTLSPEFSDALEKDYDREERPATGREVKAAKVPDLLPGRTSGDAAVDPNTLRSRKEDPPWVPSAEFWQRATDAGWDRQRVLNILFEAAWIKSDEDVTEAEATKSLAVWPEIVSMMEGA